MSERPSSAGARSPLKPLAGSGPKQRPCPSDVCAEPGCPGRRPESPARNGRKPPASPDPLGRPLAGAASEGGGHCGGRRAPLCPAPPRPGGPPRCAGGGGEAARVAPAMPSGSAPGAQSSSGSRPPRSGEGRRGAGLGLPARRTAQAPQTRRAAPRPPLLPAQPALTTGSPASPPAPPGPPPPFTMVVPRGGVCRGLGTAHTFRFSSNSEQPGGGGLRCPHRAAPGQGAPLTGRAAPGPAPVR